VVAVRPDGTGEGGGRYQEGTEGVQGGMAVAMRPDGPGEGEGGPQKGPKGV